jgi:pimeloyl-ACP methyl ester carboxylesterase
MHAALYPPWPVLSIDPAPLYLPHFADRLAPFVEDLQGDRFHEAFRAWEASFLEGTPEAPDTGLWEQLRPRQHVALSYWRSLLRRDDALALQAGWEDLLAAIRVPTLILLADPPSPEDAAILRRMPTTTSEITPGLGHALHLADPVRFAERLTAFHGSVHAGQPLGVRDDAAWSAPRDDVERPG